MRSLITLTLLALISAQLEFVSDVQELADSAPGDEFASVLHDHSDEHDHDGGLNHDGCDHCCHGAGHLNVIPGAQFARHQHSAHFLRATIRHDLVSIVETPPIPPPIV